MEDNTTTSQSTPVSNCMVTHQDHKEGLQDIQARHLQFYQTLTQIIEERDHDGL